MKFKYIVNICYIINRQGEVLLQHKARGFGVGKWNGPGGKVELGETIEESVRREILEETTLKVGEIEKIAELEFVFVDNESNNYSHVYLCRDYEGVPVNTGEGELKWYKQNAIPYDKMWEDDQYWLPKVLAGKYVKMRFNFDENQNLVNYENLDIKNSD